jgi:hypothetical protein
MVISQNNEGNILSVTNHFNGTRQYNEDFISAFIERFGEWGTITLKNRSDGMEPTVIINDANLDKSVNDDWVDDFKNFSRETKTIFTVYWAPFMGAFVNGFSYRIKNGTIVAKGVPSFGALVDVEP